MFNVDALVDIIDQRVRKIVREVLGNMASPFVYGTWVASEAEDSNLSKVTLSGTTEQARYVPKGAHVTGLSAGQTVLMVKGKGVPLTIIARVVGDIQLATV